MGFRVFQYTEKMNAYILALDQKPIEIRCYCSHYRLSLVQDLNLPLFFFSRAIFKTISIHVLGASILARVRSFGSH